MPLKILRLKKTRDAAAQLQTNPSHATLGRNLTWVGSLLDRKTHQEVQEATLKSSQQLRKSYPDLDKMELQNAKVIGMTVNAGSLDIHTAESYFESTPGVVEPTANTAGSTDEVVETKPTAKKKKTRRKKKSSGNPTQSGQLSETVPETAVNPNPPLHEEHTPFQPKPQGSGDDIPGVDRNMNASKPTELTNDLSQVAMTTRTVDTTESITRPVTKRRRTNSKSMSHMDLGQLIIPAEDHNTAVTRLRNEPSPVSLEEARGRRSTIRKERSNSIRFIQERTVSRESSDSPVVASDRGLQDPEALEIVDNSTRSTNIVGVENQGLATPPSSRRTALPLILPRKNSNAPSILNTIVEGAQPSSNPSDVGHDGKVQAQGEVSQGESKITGQDVVRPLSGQQLTESTDKKLQKLSANMPFRKSRSNSELLRPKAGMPEHPFELDGEKRNTSNDEGDLSDQESDATVILAEKARSGRYEAPKELYTYTPWATTLHWYHVGPDKKSNEEEIEAGLRPKYDPVKHLPLDPEDCARNKPGFEDVPAVISTMPSRHPLPDIEYDSLSNRFVIYPHTEPYPDLRNDLTHPDYLPPSKLCVYQAFEHGGFNVWRHDRNTFRCVLPSCHRLVYDHQTTTQICLGCGTKSWIRYCCKQHLFDDMQSHWKECGDPSTVFHEVIDEGTQPGRFYRRYPIIADANGARSFQRHRQQTYAVYNKGQYTVFLPGGLPYTVEWPERLAGLYKPRLERVLNAAFFDASDAAILEYLFRLLRFCLRQRGTWNDYLSQILTHQFRLEFGWNPAGAYDEDPCECDWLGDSANHLACPHCKKTFENVGILFRGTGFKGYVEDMEAHDWTLRVWHRQHPTVKGWRRRMMGEGFDGVPEWQSSGQWRPAMGEGWEGWGAVRDLVPELGLPWLRVK